ncbi:hypothetical protein AMECASPLE_038392 [Ameca splendens]|uniref:Uncharacterized protein n=1 Tax=Ameca splendens TaxID=208324 RepID=A0ABV1AFT7_9TELE
MHDREQIVASSGCENAAVNQQTASGSSSHYYFIHLIYSAVKKTCPHLNNEADRKMHLFCLPKRISHCAWVCVGSLLLMICMVAEQLCMTSCAWCLLAVSGGSVGANVLQTPAHLSIQITLSQRKCRHRDVCQPPRQDKDDKFLKRDR